MELLIEETMVDTSALERAENFIATIDAYPDIYHGRGIVVCGGGVKYFTNAWIAISLLRHVGCTLPVQLWYLGRNEIDPYMEEIISPLGVECIDARIVEKTFPARILRGWELKPFAILHSSFREVMLLDADNYVAANPQQLFESWEYRETGALFWPDVGHMAADHPAWRVFGVNFVDEPEIESGQLLVNKEKCWKALCLTKHYNDYSDFYYRHVHGDKETFHFAFRKMGHRYAMTSYAVKSHEGTFFQHDFAGKLLFQHRTRAKWELHGPNPAVSQFRFETKCRDYLEELRAVWDGVVGGPRKRFSAQDVLDATDELTSNIYRFVRHDQGYWPISFMADGRIGIGATQTEQKWRVRIVGGRLALELGTDQIWSHMLQPNESGWSCTSGTKVEPIPKRSGVSTRTPMSLNEFTERALWYAEPLSQNTGTGNLGFGWIYYSMVRNLRPDFAIVIGSARGFAPLCVARGMQDNGAGEVVFIDPAYTGSGDPAWDGRGHWEHATEVEKWFDVFGITGWIRHLKMRSEDAIPSVREIVAGKYTGLVVIDGAHTYENSLQDFDLYSSLMSDGVVLFHDATNPNCGVSLTLQALRTRGLDVVTLNLDVGLSMVTIKHPPRVDDKWSYLTTESDRGDLIMEHLRPLLCENDQIFEAYCGFSPLNEHYENVQVFGFDVDPAIIERLRTRYPQHKWAQIEEKHLAYAELPEEIDTLVGLGLSYGYCSWDAQLVESNIRLLLRIYRPRVCLFETAADYHDGEILDTLKNLLQHSGYTTSETVIHTSMKSYNRRRLLIGKATS